MRTKFELTEEDVVKIEEFIKNVDEESPSEFRCVLGIRLRYWFEPNSIGVVYGVDYKGKTLNLTDIDSW